MEYQGITWTGTAKDRERGLWQRATSCSGLTQPTRKQNRVIVVLAAIKVIIQIQETTTNKYYHYICRALRAFCPLTVEQKTSRLRNQKKTFSHQLNHMLNPCTTPHHDIIH